MDAQRWMELYRLKDLERAGWKRVGIQTPETVASHSWGVQLLCLFFGPKIQPSLDLTKTLAIATVHDLPEVRVGDITPHDQISKQDKSLREERAARDVLPPSLYELWREYEDNLTRESQFVHAMDKLDMAIQAQLYAEKTQTLEFMESAQGKFPQEWTWIWEHVFASTTD